MGIASSKDESGKVVLAGLPPGFLDYEGREMRDQLDECLGRSMWYFTIVGLAITVPICIKYRTERPLMAAAISCPVLDMMYGTIRCEPEKQAFLDHYKRLQESLHRQAAQRQQQQLQALEPDVPSSQQQQQEQPRSRRPPGWRPWGSGGDRPASKEKDGV